MGSLLTLFGQPYVHTPLTLSGNEITDGTRGAALAGDGLSEDSSYGIWESSTNLCTNGGFETNTTGWTTGGTNTIASSATRFKFGAKSCLATYADNATLADFAITITNAAHTASCWVYIPTAYDGAGIELRQLNYTVAASAVAANMATRDAWQRLSLTFTPGADVIGNIQINNTGAAPTATRFIYIDGVQVERRPIATPYVETDGGTASRSAASVSAPASLLNETQGWMMMRWRCPRTTPQTTSFGRFFEWGTNSSDVIYMGLSGSGAGSVPLYFTRHTTTSAGHYTSPNIGAELVAGTVYTIGAQWDAAGYSIFVNGVRYGVTADTLVPVIPETTFDIGGDGTGLHAGGEYPWFACGTGTLTDADAALFYAWGNSDPQWHWFPKSAVITGLWHARSPMMKIRRGL